jgi:serine phosphatase RsbU (regulator of sigma subunit)
LIAHGEVLGGILVSYAVDLLRGDSQRVMELFFDQHLPILQGIAHQAAVAIDNERLLKAQKEEAYISVAMLQIAQAVATQRELAQTLETIVRITPLLVGVQRVVVYLYDEQSGVFELVESYGLPQEFTLNQFVPDEFAMLDAVCCTNTFLAVPAVLDWDETEDIHDAWVQLKVPDIDQVQEMIAIDIPLTFFFPLSVQGGVFGVMLVEEADHSSGDVLTRGSSIGGLRGRRMELLDGISKQLSLAVQNDLLQQDTLERERLERELQLAREIQRTFLPRSLPQVPGWEVDTRWRTARQVGGDFYDCFMLADGKVCLVIADVADKGMPAALYMTLVRTLVRAAAKDHLSPSAVLQGVNDILVPDSQQGMFVTVFFAVLTTDSGELVYANAGQNPPYWVRHREADLIPLEKSGMALGVLEGNRIEQRTITLQDGDFLVMYTDGLTEAVSAAGELFGEERLIGAVQRAVFNAGQDEHGLPADSLIDRLDQQVSEFVGNAPRADDLTLLVLKKIARDGDQELKKSPDLGGASPAI